MPANLFVVFLKRLIFAIFFICRQFLRILTCHCFRRPQRIGELPMYVGGSKEPGGANNNNAFHGGDDHPTMNATTMADSSWSSWSSDQANANSAVSEQIEEYRRRRQEEMLTAKAAKKKGHPHGGGESVEMAIRREAEKNAESDLFAELQPNVVAPKKLIMRPNQEIEMRTNLFQVQDETDAFFRSQASHGAAFGELAEMDERGRAETAKTDWLDEEENIDADELDEFDREQRRREREERKMKRQAEHAQQLEEKRRQQQKVGRSAAEQRQQQYSIQF